MKMEIKVRCACGSLFSFDDEPVNGRLEFPIACTNCGTDCTDKANEFIRKKLANPAADPTEPPPRKGLFGSKKAREDEQPHDFTGKAAREAAAEVIGDETSMARVAFAGMVALLVGCLGAVGWLLIAKATGFQIGIVAWALGGLVGYSSKLVAPRGHHLLGVVGTLAAFIAIAGGQFLVSRWEIQDEIHRFAPEAYQAAEKYAKEAADAKSDDDLRESVASFKLVRALVGEQPVDPIEAYQQYQINDSVFTLMGLVQVEGRRKMLFEEQYKLANEGNVKQEEIAAFKAKVLPALKQFAAGKPDEATYKSKLENALMAGVTFKSIVFNSIHVYSGVWLLLGLGTAYRLARNKGLQY